MAVMLVGCSIMEDQDNPCPNPEDSEFINLTFNMVVPIARQTRTDDFHDEIDSEWPEVEDLIYTDDFAFYLYAVLPDGTQPFIAKIDDISSITGGNGTYTLQITLEKSKFEEVVPKENNIVKFKIAVFANTNKKYNNLSETDYASFETLIDTASQWDFSIFGTIYAGTGTVDGNLRSGARLPMYGTSTLEVTRDQVYMSRPETPLWGGEISMLRSVAKVQVLDEIINRDQTTGLPRIEAVTFIGPSDKAYILPYDASNYQNGKQIETPNNCEGNQRELGLLKRENNKWIGYIPEQSVKGSKFVINVTYYLKEDGTPLDPMTFEVPMTGYNDQTFKFGDFILRNHIYTLSVKSVETSKPSIEVSVKQWRKINFEYEY